MFNLKFDEGWLLKLCSMYDKGIRLTKRDEYQVLEYRRVLAEQYV